MLDLLTRVTCVDLMSGKPLPVEPCWVDQVIKDIPVTMMGYIGNAPANVKALTFVPTIDRVDGLIRKACAEKGITVVWATPPKFVRYLDDLTECE